MARRRDWREATSMTRTITTLLLSVVLGLTTIAAQKKTAPPRHRKPPDDIGKRINTPRPDARTVTFETREGTWMSVDVSPDGRTLVFDLLGDLYTLPIEGGVATAISRGPAYDHHPRFSPDGRLRRLHVGRRGHGEPLARECRRHEPSPDHRREDGVRPQRRVAARRRLPRRPTRRGQARGSAAQRVVAVPPAGRHGSEDHRRRRPQRGHRARRLAGREVHLLRRTAPALLVRARPARRACGRSSATTDDQRAHDVDQRDRRRGASGDLARWADAGLHQPPRRGHRAGGAHA